MTNEQSKRLDEILNQQDKIFNMWMEYWKDFSNFGTWQFWAIALTLVIPLIVVYFAIDKTKAFHIGFFGFNIHTWFTYADAIAMRAGYVAYPFQAIPIMPVNFALDAALVPVSFMLLYQWCLNHNKNFFLYAVLVSAFASFIFKPILVSLDLIQLNKGLNYFGLFLLYILILIMSITITKLFRYFKRKGCQEQSPK
ncbi:CBO0543 family protein [Paenisporosarcina sp. TG20]|uniref:CBO0543 family protein n=1 Tax=Paenisporosarcina sp. TG20 TaxID=1211706 RepID=UPI0002FA0068|nr:CBO0543 family protein [Paenisporosarcina sp. TG20]